MKTKMQTYSVSEELNQLFGAPGTESRRAAEKQAWEEYNTLKPHDENKSFGEKTFILKFLNV